MRHAKELADARVTGWDVRADRRAEVEELLEVETVSSEEAFFAAAPDAVFICVPPADHEHYIYRAIERDIPFMVEQPISHVIDNLDDIFERVRAAGLVCHVSSNQRYSPRLNAIAQALDTSGVGRVLTGIVEIGEWLPNWHPYEPYTDYYPSWRNMGGGLDAICDLDWLRMLFGEVRDSRSMCSRKSDLEIDTYDVVQMLLDFVDGPQIVLHCDMLQQPFARQSRFVCENGVVVHNHPDQHASAYVADKDEWREFPFGVDLSLFPTMQGKPNHAFAEPMYVADTAQFLGALEKNAADMTSLRTGIENLKVVQPLIFGTDR